MASTMAMSAASKRADVESPRVDRLALYLVKPSRYDDDGYPVRHFRGTVPSNTLCTLYGLTQEAAQNGSLGSIRVETDLVDEAIQRIPYRRMLRDRRRRGTRVVIALCGVQTNQFPRALDLARRFRQMGLEVLIGGFHVSGANALVEGTAPELQAMMDLGVHLFRGEAEDCWGDLLRQAAAGTLPPMVDRLRARPSLRDRQVPVVPREYLRRFALSGLGILDAGRGCPFDCSFCTIVNVQGRGMRCRPARDVLAGVRHQGARGARYFFFTDDNFARHPEWAGILEGMAALRREGQELTLVIQVDMLASRIPGFVEKAKAAGCVQVFIGLESISAANLLAGNKPQNLAADARATIEAWHAHGIVTHCGYILGFPEDTPATIADDVRRLRDDVGVDLASFFILTPLPGSRDHARAVERGAELDADLNQYDSVRPVSAPLRMTREELQLAYRRAWKDFYTVAHMKRCLARLEGESYWSLFTSYAWHRNAMELGEHPMMSGFYRLRDRGERRAAFPREGILAFSRRHARETVRQVRVWVRLFFEMQEVWLTTRSRDAEEGRWRAIIKSIAAARPASLLSHAAAWIHRRRVTREDLNAFWSYLKRWHWIRANPLRLPLIALRESTLGMHFLLQMCMPAVERSREKTR
jgi:radical SAM superfamily enzyme YgiQ (UPF0313 family)